MSGFWIGACHYPEQFPADECERDASLMAEANLNVVRLGELAWGRLEPSPGRFDFDWMERFLDTFHRCGISVLYGTPTACMPPWLPRMEPDVLPIDERGVRCSYGSWGSACLNNELYLARCDAIVEALADRFGGHPAILGWQIDNESLANACYCDDCRLGFQRWLQDRYGSLDSLNEAWGTSFWTHLYQDWSEIPAPAATVRIHHHNPSMRLDYARFQSETNVRFIERQARILRSRIGARFLTHNVAGRATHVDYFRVAEGLDVMGWDSYPVWTGKHPWGSAMGNDLARGLKGGPFWVPEHEVGRMDQWRWEAVPDGMVRLWTYQAVARGAEGIVYFLWRAGRGGAEQYIQSIVGHDGRKTRVYDEIARTAGELRSLAGSLADTRVEASVAILHDYEDHWALGIQPMGHGLENPWIYAEEWYEALHRRNVSCDFVRKDNPRLLKYRVVITAASILTDPEWVEMLTDYVSDGGTLILGVRSGSKTRTNLWPQGPLPGPLSDLVGATIEEFESLPPEVYRTLVDENGHRVVGARWFESLNPTGAVVMLRYRDGVFAGRPAVVTRKLGKGSVTYVGAMGEEVAGFVLDRIGLVGDTNRKAEVVVRSGPGHGVRFVLDHDARSVEVQVTG